MEWVQKWADSAKRKKELWGNLTLQREWIKTGSYNKYMKEELICWEEVEIEERHDWKLSKRMSKKVKVRNERNRGITWVGEWTWWKQEYFANIERYGGILWMVFV